MFPHEDTSRSHAILTLRCPRCLKGKVFRGAFAMNEVCAECGIKFEREPGYFLGAMYVSYALAVVILAAFGLPFFFLFPDWEIWQCLLAAYVPLMFLLPAVFRYSRVIWMHLDRWADPSPEEKHD